MFNTFITDKIKVLHHNEDDFENSYISLADMYSTFKDWYQENTYYFAKAK